MTMELTIELVDTGADPDALDELTGNLRLELLELDVDSVVPVAAGPAPLGSKGLELAAVGALLVQLKGSAALVGSVVTTIRSWLQRGPSTSQRTLKITVEGHTLELGNATAEQQQQLVEQFLQSLPASEG